MTNDIKIGDPVEYRVIDRNEGEKWIPATVTFVDYTQIVVEDANHMKHAIPRKSTEWRRIRNEE